jgi:uncharacterized protein
MVRKLIFTIVIQCSLLITCSYKTSAQDNIDPLKKELIKELLVLMHLEKNAELFFDAVLKQGSQDMAHLMAARIDDKEKLSPAKRERFKQLTEESMKLVSKRYSELLKKRINLYMVLEEVSYQLYDKHFTVEDLKGLIAFYKTATGQKSIQVMPQLMQESMSLTSQKLMAAMTDVSKEVEKELQEFIEDKATEFQEASSELVQENVKEEGEVDTLLKELKEKNELVVGVCLDDKLCKPIDKYGKAKLLVTKRREGIPHPPYPPVAKAARVHGRVEVKMVIDETGKVIGAQVIDGHPLLRSASLKAARELTFPPALLDKKPVKVTGIVAYNFILK